MRVDYESTQTVEIVTADGYREAEIVIGLEQTHVGTAPSFNPMDGGDPGSEPEWDPTYIAFIDGGGKPVEFVSYIVMKAIAETIFGDEIWDALVEAAIVDANENFDGGHDG